MSVVRGCAILFSRNLARLPEARLPLMVARKYHLFIGAEGEHRDLTRRAVHADRRPYQSPVDTAVGLEPGLGPARQDGRARRGEHELPVALRKIFQERPLRSRNTPQRYA